MSESLACSDLPELEFASIRQMILAHAVEQELDIVTDDGFGLCIDTYYGSLGFSPLRVGTRVKICAPHPDYVQILKDSLVDQIGMHFPSAALGLRWEGAAQKSELPANIWAMKLVSVVVMDCGFLRVTLHGDVSRFSDDAIHFRLGIAPNGRPIQWPKVGANGSTEWPLGADKLHLPVYTARHMNQSNGTLSFDIFSHAGGRATQWARSVPAGADVLITSPGGGGCNISQSRIIGFADETGFPAVARILEANPDLTGQFILYGDQARTTQYPLPKHAGVDVSFAATDRKARMAQDAIEIFSEKASSFLWFVGDRAQASAVRTDWRKRGHDRKSAYISGFWG